MALIDTVWSRRSPHREAPHRRTRRSKRLRVLEALEDRLLLSGGPTVYTVNAITDIGAGSGTAGDLLYCITQANSNSNSEGSEVQFDPTIFGTPQTITLSSTLTLSETAGPEVISGPGANLVTISGNNMVRVVLVHGDERLDFHELDPQPSTLIQAASAVLIGLGALARRRRRQGT